MTTFLLWIALVLASPPTEFEDTFTGATLRFDYFHGGTATEEDVSLDRIRLEGTWPGSRIHLLDDTNLGKYLFVVVDAGTNRPIYSRGFASIYGEWETTGEARSGVRRTFHESCRFPEPKGRCQLVLKKRGDDGSFREIFTCIVDPDSRFVDRSPVAPAGEVRVLFESGPAATKVDLLILGDGYSAAEIPEFHADVDRLAGVLFDTEPFRSRKADFNVRTLAVPSRRSGISNPRQGFWNSTPLGLSFNALDSDRYLLTFENEALREIAAAAPYDALILLAHTRKYGGGGIFNLYATCASDTEPAEYVFVHEFGHSFAGLADEYYTSDVAYEEYAPTDVEPWEPNITALLDPSRLKWKELVEPDTPIPTPWNQEAYDKDSYAFQKRRRTLREEGAPEETVEALFREVKEKTAPMLASERWAGKVGAFEGAGYRARGLYRPEIDCLMFTRNPKDFCRVCRRAIERVIDLYAE
jgi:hypothetical protein